MAKYFDNREQREKTIPDCSKAGLVWNPNTQRCEQMSAINTLLQAANLAVRVNPPQQGSGMGFLEYDGYDDWDLYWDNYYWDGGDGYLYFNNGYYDYLDDVWYDYGGSYSDLQSTLDWWANLDNSAPFEYDPITNTYRFPEPNTADDLSDLQSSLDWWSSLSQTPAGNAENDPWLPDDFWDWLTNTIEQIPGTNPNLPGYCPAGTYHPVNDPYSCVPFPTDPAGNRAAQNQRKQQQQTAQKAAQAARNAQKKQDQQCQPINGQRAWKNPQTGKCEPVPACPQGQQFDSASRRCLTPQQIKQLYGEGNNWLLWALIAIGAIVVIKK